ncbi:MAG: polysaccharide biosynthesis tyrosine autokinase [Sphingobacteriales bacterium]|nr:polysaccharide biosynthesis tyrosine autokinase [Sphingobacteriales bacterium]
MQEQINNSNKSELWSLSFRDLFYKYVRFLPLFVLSVALTLLGAYVYLRYSVPIYRVGSSMVVKSEQTNRGGTNKFEDVFINDKAQNIQTEIEVLKSTPLMKRVVDSLHLQFSYYAIGKIKTVNVYRQKPFILNVIKISDSSVSFSISIRFINERQFRINGDKKTFSFGETFANANGIFSLSPNPYFIASSGEFKATWLPSSAAAGVYAGALTVTPKTPGTGILLLSLMTPNPQLGADILNGLMAEYALYSIEQKRETSDKILSFIESRLSVTGHELDSVQNVLLDYKERNNIIDPELQIGSYFDKLSESDNLINQLTSEINKADLLKEYLFDKKNEFSKVPSAFSLQDVTLGELVTGYNKAQLERQQLIEANIPPENPRVKESEAQIEKLRVFILESLKNLKASMSNSVGDLRKKNEENQAQLTRMPRKTKEQLQIEQHVEALQTLYKFLQEQREQNAITRASAISSSNIIDRSYPSNTPVKPNKKAIRILAVLLGLGLPALFIFIGEVLNDKVSTRFDIEKITAAPILGEIGHSYSKNVMVVNKTTRSMVAEQFRIIRSNLQYILNQIEKSVILVTSSFSGEGKSYVTTNMGAVLALAGKKTIILEFDIRKPKLLSGLGISKGPGITNFLVGKSRLEDVIKQVPDQENLFILGCGPIPPNPAELLLSPKVEEMFSWLRQNFDVVLVDTAPVGMVSDAMTLSKFSDATLYLVRQGHTFKKQIALIDEFYIGQKLPKISIVINDVKLKPGYGYYGYGRYGYGYGYGYGSYYEEETPPQNLFEKLVSKLDIRKIFTGSKRK